MEDEKMTCNCTGKVFWGILIAVVITALAVGGGVYWWAKKATSSTKSTASTSSTSSTPASTASVTLDQTKGKWSQNGDLSYDYTSDQNIFRITIPLTEINAGDGSEAITNKDEWVKFVKTVKVTQGDKPNILNITFATTDKNMADYSLTQVGVFTVDEWKQIAAEQYGQKPQWTVVDVDKEGRIIAVKLFDRGGEWPSDWPESAQLPFNNLQPNEIVAVY